MAVFPGGVVNFGAERLDGDYIPASDINLVRAEVMAIETALGASLANIPSSADLVRVNYLVNGGFDFAQRQTAGTLTTIASEKYSADRWRVASQVAGVQYQRLDGTWESGLTSLYFGNFKWSAGSAGKFMLHQPLEAMNSVPLRGKTVVFQVKLKASTAKIIRMGLLELQSTGAANVLPATFVTAWGASGIDPTLGGNLALVAAQSKSVGNSWQQFSLVASVPLGSKNIICALWADGAFLTNETLSVAEAGLFVGTIVQAWAPRPAQQELALCQRYFERFFPGASNHALAFGQAYSVSSFFAAYLFKVPKLAVPVVSFSAVGTWSLWGAVAVHPVSNIFVYKVNEGGVTIQAIPGTNFAFAGAAVMLATDGANGAGAYMDVEAEL